MPIFDKPLDELKLYQGTNPRPHDFDAYWDAALEEQSKTDPKVVLERSGALSSKKVECFDLWYSGVGGARIYAKYMRPKGAKRCPGALVFHGYSGSSGDWSGLLSLASEGFCVAAMDCRGQGGRSEDVGGVRGTTLRGHIVRGLSDPDSRKLLFRDIFLDTAQLARVVASFDEVDEERMAATGGSQGGGLALACAALYPGIKRAASRFPFLCDYQRVWEMDLAKHAYEELSQYFRHFDPRHERKLEIFTKLGYVDCQNLAPRIEAETLMLTGLMDQVCPPSTQFAAYNKIGSKKEMVIYPDFGHENLPDGNDIVFNFLCQM